MNLPNYSIELKDYSKYPDQKLIKSLKKGKMHAFNELYRRYAGKVLGFASSYFWNEIEAEDIVQEVFIQIWERRKELKADCSFQSFLFTCVKNRVLNRIRNRKAAIQYQDLDLDLLIDDSVEEPESFFGIKEKTAAQILGSLSPTQKQIFSMSKLEGYSHQEIANMLNISIRTVEHHIYLAKKQLKNDLIGQSSSLVLISLVFLS